MQPGHEYTKSNAKFCLSVLETPLIKALAEHADKNQETQGQYTMGDEKLHNVFMMPQVSRSGAGVELDITADKRLAELADPRGHWRDRPGGNHDETEGDEEQFQGMNIRQGRFEQCSLRGSSRV